MDDWRKHCATIIAAVIKRYGSDPKELKRQIRLAYPYGERKRYPYKIWLDEIRRQLKIKPKPKENDGQGKLF